MTERLYYRDAALRSFTGRVLRSEAAEGGRYLTVLDRTAFYPTSGGQLFDLGRLGGGVVLDVIDEDDDVVHVMDVRLEAGSEVDGEIDWPRRFDHMQQHTGQHILSAAFERTAGVATVGVHFSAASATIDLARDVTPAGIDRAEADANAVVWENRTVAVRFVSSEEAASLPLRKESKRSGTLRLVEIPDFDLSACGGTHVARTGEVGIIAVSAWERFKTGTRITFRCGNRVLDAHRSLRDGAAEAGRLLSVGPLDVASALGRLTADVRTQEKRLAELGNEVASYRAATWRGEAETIGRFRGVLRSDASAGGAAIRTIAQAVVAGDAGLVAVIAGGGTPTPIVVARSAGVDLDAGVLMKLLTGAIGGRGGGRAELAQGGVDADAERALVTARQLLAAR